VLALSKELSTPLPCFILFLIKTKSKVTTARPGMLTPGHALTAEDRDMVCSELKVQNSSTFQGLSRTQIAFFKHQNYRQKAIS